MDPSQSIIRVFCLELGMLRFFATRNVHAFSNPAPCHHKTIPTTTIRMKHLATYLLLKLGGKDSPSSEDVTKALASVGIPVEAERLEKMMKELEGKDVDELIAKGRGLMVTFGSGVPDRGVGTQDAAAVHSVEAPAIEEPLGPDDLVLDVDGPIGIFGDDGGGGGADY